VMQVFFRYIIYRRVFFFKIPTWCAASATINIDVKTRLGFTRQAVIVTVANVNCSRVCRELLSYIILSLLMSYIYGAPGKARNLTSYIYGRDVLLGILLLEPCISLIYA
jgi:hypothetical protein